MLRLLSCSVLLASFGHVGANDGIDLVQKDLSTQTPAAEPVTVKQPDEVNLDPDKVWYDDMHKTGYGFGTCADAFGMEFDSWFGWGSTNKACAKECDKLKECNGYDTTESDGNCELRFNQGKIPAENPNPALFKDAFLGGTGAAAGVGMSAVQGVKLVGAKDARKCFRKRRQLVKVFTPTPEPTPSPTGIPATPAPTNNNCFDVECGKHGSCYEGSCECHQCWQGAQCESEPDACCDVDCGDHGSCSDGKCTCKDCYVGDYCSKSACEDVSCGEHGMCNMNCEGETDCGSCICADGWSGPNCGIPPDPCKDVFCGDHGICKDGTCVCIDCYSGCNCDINPCLDVNCGDNGYCYCGTCRCKEGWTGPDCDMPMDVCFNIVCGDNGFCSDGKCKCEAGFSGDTCEVGPCTGVDCGNHGSCKGGQCACEDGWSGDKCGVDACSDVSCGDHGVCNKGYCACEGQWSGPRCEIEGVIKELPSIVVPNN